MTAEEVRRALDDSAVANPAALASPLEHYCPPVAFIRRKLPPGKPGQTGNNIVPDAHAKVLEEIRDPVITR
jgi:hypothetical protein